MRQLEWIFSRDANENEMLYLIYIVIFKLKQKNNNIYIIIYYYFFLGGGLQTVLQMYPSLQLFINVNYNIDLTLTCHKKLETSLGLAPKDFTVDPKQTVKQITKRSHAVKIQFFLLFV